STGLPKRNIQMFPKTTSTQPIEVPPDIPKLCFIFEIEASMAAKFHKIVSDSMKAKSAYFSLCITRDKTSWVMPVEPSASGFSLKSGIDIEKSKISWE